jgi:hypothetical protein
VGRLADSAVAFLPLPAQAHSRRWPQLSQHTPAARGFRDYGSSGRAGPLPRGHLHCVPVGPAVSNPREGSRSARRSDPTQGTKDKVPRRWALGINRMVGLGLRTGRRPVSVKQANSPLVPFLSGHPRGIGILPMNVPIIIGRMPMPLPGPAEKLHRLNRQTAHSSRFLSDGHADRVSLPARSNRRKLLRSLRYLLFKSPAQPGRLFSISALVGYFRTKWSRRSIASIGLCPARPRRMTLILCSCSSGRSSSSRRVPERKMSTAG